jgi:hypothetical protein
MTVPSRHAADPRQPTVRSEACHRRRQRVSSSSSLLLFAFTLFGACFAASAQSPAGSGLGSADGDQPGIRAVITELKRAGNTVTLKFVIYNDSAADYPTNGRFTDGDYKGYKSFSGVHLFDQPNKKKYYAVKDSDSICVCTDDMDAVKAKSSAIIWVKYAAPPETTQKVTVQIPHFVPVEDVPIH